MSIPFYVFDKKEGIKKSEKNEMKVKTRGLSINFEEENIKLIEELANQNSLRTKDVEFMKNNSAKIKFMNIMILVLTLKFIKYCKNNEKEFKKYGSGFRNEVKSFFEDEVEDNFRLYLSKIKCVDKDGKILLGPLSYQIYVYKNAIKSFNK